MTAIEFWQTVGTLHELLDHQGLTADERLNAVVAKFSDLPPTVQRQLVSDLLRLSLELPDIYAAVVAAANSAEERSYKLSAG